jgi:hypothetical protein
MTDFPKKIKFLSDDTELEFVEKCFFEKKKSNDKLAKYIYTKAEVHIGKEVVFNLEQLIYLESCSLLKVIS